MKPQERKRLGLHIVIAEDSPTQAELLKESLLEEGYDVTVAPDGLSALDAARRIAPALIVTDVVMPDMDGYQLCRAVKADPKLHDVPVMIVTSLRETDDIVRALECGADNFIRKPFDHRALLARIDYLLANRKVRSHSKLQFGIEISLAGRKYQINADREQILGLLFSSYEEALMANEELRRHQEEIQALNIQLAARAVELEDANKQLRAFSHTVSHDLRSPLATIGGFCGVLEHKYASALDAKGVRYLGGIAQEAQRMKRIVDDVLYLANVDATRVKRDEVDLAAMAAELVHALQQGAPAREVDFRCAAGMRARCDERLVRVALANLLGNAWKFTGKQARSRIEFDAETVEGRQVFLIRDNGAGFDMRFSERLFKAFERLHTNAEFEGFGVGLATVQRIVALHGGRIWAESAPGEGATFRFTLD